MATTQRPRMYRSVALRKESVDRNFDFAIPAAPGYVALRKESVDRNYARLPPRQRYGVALRKESVDRNMDTITVTGD